jgi:hypothetical protein
MNIILNRSDFEYLISLNTLPNELDYIKKGDEVTIIGDKEIIEVLLDKVSDILSDKGFDLNDNLTPTGIRLERIIDLISEVFYD